ncbi:UDP-N-acetylglucosamine transferase subunit ALG14 isoform X1 [Genypterus blacodes]|uniref:UDP-N-acetylglucosamine transferase subunit ALG14 isoform X1 n=1 Tax=Genypterus blacodes TaxID=154954 RepID=UPI003F770EAF
MALLAVLGALLLLCFVFLLRLFIVVKTGSECKPGAKGSVSVLVVAGSGGHTAEILRLVDVLSPLYSPRCYVVADSDRMSEEKICSFEASKGHTEFSIFRVPRSREVHQSWLSSVLSTLKALSCSVPLLYRLRPDVVLCNGPGTCVPVCVAALLLALLGLKEVQLVYVESVCRVDTLSLSGRLLYPLSHHFLVQWSGLRDRYPKAVFLGRLV